MNPFTQAEIKAWIEQHRWDQKYFEKIEDNGRSLDYWATNVDGANLLQDLFSTLSNARYDYDSNKVSFGESLTDWLVENSPQDLDGLVNDLKWALSLNERRQGEIHPEHLELS